MKAEAERSGTIYETDQDARLLKSSSSGADISQPTDKEQLYSMAAQANENMETDALSVIADKGYYTSKQFEKCEKANITAIVSKANHSSAAVSEEYSKDMFTYDESADTYICPLGQVLKRRQSRKVSKHKDCPSYSNQTVCCICPVRDKCTRGNTGGSTTSRCMNMLGQWIHGRSRIWTPIKNVSSWLSTPLER